MLRKILAVVLVCVVAGWGFTGCADKDEVPATEEPKSMAEYSEEAAKTINEKNAEAELEKEIKAIEAEAAEE